MTNKRLLKVKQILEENKLGGFIFFNNEYNDKPNVQYLSGFTGSYSILLITKQNNYIITDTRYFVQVQEESDFQLIKQIERDPWPIIRKLLQELKITRLGFELDKLSVEKYKKLQKMNLKLYGFEKLILGLRAIKDKEELKLIKTACHIASKAFENLFPKIKIGMKESELAAELTYEMRKLGAEKPIVGHLIVVSGKRGQWPHGRSSDKIIEDGDFITIDSGAVYKGYASDITRTVGVGNVSNDLIKIYEIVLEAQKRTILSASSQHTGASLDKIAREFISSKGYGPYFTHSTGHGIGLEAHELPLVNKDNKDILPVNSAITIEPGIYIPELGGVRIEDDIIIKEDGCEVISHVQKDLIILNK